jgi:hypothetical protein
MLFANCKNKAKNQQAKLLPEHSFASANAGRYCR